MEFRLLAVCILVIQILNSKHVCATVAKIDNQLSGTTGQDSGELLGPYSHSRRENTDGNIAINPDVDLSVKQSANLETILNNILHSQLEIRQNLNDLRKEVTRTQQELRDELIHIKTKVMDIGRKSVDLETQSEAIETHVTDQKHQIEELIKASGKMQHQLLLNDNAIRQMARGIKDTRRATSLLALTEITTADLPYVSHCDQVVGGIEEDNHIDACIQTRMVALYTDLNSVLNVHVMLVDGKTPNEGRVEVISNGRHGSICQSNWDYNESRVVCRMLRYKGGSPIYRNRFGRGNSEILFTYVSCNGKENSIFACKHQIAEKEGISCERAAVKCR